MRENSLRRPTLKGYPEVLTAAGLRSATPRLGRFDENEPATLDPRLPRPAPMPDVRMYPEKQRADLYLQVYNGKPPSALWDGAKGYLADTVLGGTGLEMQALMKVLKKEPDWIQRYMSGKLPEQSTGPSELPAAAANEPRSVWRPPPPPDFSTQYEAAWRRFWPRLNQDLRIAREEAPVRATAVELARSQDDAVQAAPGDAAAPAERGPALGLSSLAGSDSGATGVAAIAITSAGAAQRPPPRRREERCSADFSPRRRPAVVARFI